MDTFEEYIQQTLPQINPDEMAQIRSVVTTKRLRKRQVLLHEGEVCRHKMFVMKGLLRNYRRGEDGNEYVMRFAREGEWTSDMDSLLNATPSAFYIDALEDSEVMMWTRENFDFLRRQIPALNMLSEYVMNQTMNAIQKRVLLSISSSPEERYLDFISSFPNVFQRVPLHMIASYLGVSRETLTRVRQGLAVNVKG